VIREKESVIRDEESFDSFDFAQDKGLGYRAESIEQRGERRAESLGHRA